MVSEEQRKIIRALKDMGFPDGGGNIPVINDKKAIIGSLCPINNRSCLDQEVISALTRWRKRFAGNFFSQFVPSDERTKKWLESVIVSDDARIIFLMRDEKNKAIGNVGVCNISDDSAEFDNLIRGERGGDGKLVFFSVVSFINWIYKTLKVDRICLHVFSNNLKAIALYESVGFSRDKIYKCIKKQEHGETHYVIDRLNKAVDGELCIARMSLVKRKFFNNHSWLKE